MTTDCSGNTMAQYLHGAERRFAAIATALARPAVTLSKPVRGRFGCPALKVHDRIFAMLSAEGDFVVRLPKTRVDAMVSAGTGERFNSHGDGPLEEWLEMQSGSALQWLELAEEALAFVGT